MLFRLHQNQSTAMLQKKHPNDQRVFPVTHDSASHSASRFHSYRYHMQKLRFCEKWVERAPLKSGALLPKLSLTIVLSIQFLLFTSRTLLRSSSLTICQRIHSTPYKSTKETFRSLLINKESFPLLTVHQRKHSIPY